jgi:hypothetical protein
MIASLLGYVTASASAWMHRRLSWHNISGGVECL